MTDRLKNSKSLLAKLMAKEDITVVHRKVPTAYFDLSTRTLCCPIFKDDLSPELYDLFMGHEVGHALKTPYEGLHSTVSDNPILKGYLNVVEDVRIESYIKNKYQGLRRSFFSAYNELMDMDFFGVANTNLQSISLIDKINLITKVGTRVKIQLSPVEQKYLDMAKSCKSWDDVVECATAIYEYSGKEEYVPYHMFEDLAQTSPELTNQDDTQNEGDSDSDEISRSESMEKIKQILDMEGEESDNQTDDEESDSSETTSKSTSEEESVEESDGESSSFPQGGINEAREAITETNAHQNEALFLSDDSLPTSEIFIKQRFDDDTFENHYVSHKDINDIFTYWESRIEKDSEWVNNERWSKTALKKLLEKNKKIVMQMAKEFEVKQTAERFVRANISKTGKLDMNRIAKYKVVDDIFKRSMIIPDGKNHGIVVLLDWSASIIKSVPDLLEQALILVEFCRKAEIPHRICLFSDYFRHALDSSSYGNGLGNVLELFSDTMKLSDYKKMLNNVSRLWVSAFNRRTTWKNNLEWEQFFGEDRPHWTSFNHFPAAFNLGGTPLDSAIISMRTFLPEFTKCYSLEKTILTVVTDGWSHHSPVMDVTDEEWSVIDRQTDGLRSTRHRVNRVIVDPFSRKTYPYSTGGRVYYNSNSFTQTQNLLEWVSEETGCIVTGHFFISNKSDYVSLIRAAYVGDNSWEEYEEKMKLWKTVSKTGIVLDVKGYNKLFVAKTSNMSVLGDDELDEELSNASVRKINSAFKKNQKSKTTSRFLVNKFIQEIA